MIAWIGVGLGAASVAAWVLLVVQARRLWRQLRPVVAPYLAMLAPPAETESMTTPYPEVESASVKAAYDATTGERFLISPADDDDGA